MVECVAQLVGGRTSGGECDRCVPLEQLSCEMSSSSVTDAFRPCLSFRFRRCRAATQNPSAVSAAASSAARTTATIRVTWFSLDAGTGAGAAGPATAASVSAAGEGICGAIGKAAWGAMAAGPAVLGWRGPSTERSYDRRACRALAPA